MLGAKWEGTDNLVKTLTQAATGARKAIMRGVLKGALRVESTAKRIVYAGHPDHLEGDKGLLRRSITHREDDSKLAVDVGSNVVYARIHELGGVIVPVNSRYLVFRPNDFAPAERNIGGKIVKYNKRTASEELIFATKVTMPARPYLGPALEEEGPHISEDVRASLLQLVQG
jgi:phage gpG-like protein